MSAEGVRAFVGLGTNIEPREERMKRAIEAIAEIATVVRSSALYETSPVGPKDQPDFLNAVLEVHTLDEVAELMSALKDLEKFLGREHHERWQKREIDLDLLLYNNEIVSLDGLSIPHPELHRRKFVLEPLCELAPDLVHPVLAKTISALNEGLDDPEQRIRRL